MTKVLVLHRRLSGYFIACLARLLETGVSAKVVAWPNQKDAPFDAEVLSALGFVANRSNFSDAELLKMALDFQPDAVLLAGWSDRGYVKVCKRLKAKDIPIIAGCDTQWKGSLRQYIACALAPWYVHKFIDVLWVSGERQRQLANKLSYQGARCWDGYYACDWDFFSATGFRRLKQESEMLEDEQHPEAKPLKSFAFVGRYAPEKGLKTLAEAYKLYSQEVAEPWKLVCAGKGCCKSLILDAGAEDLGFIQPEALPEFLAGAHAFILPSNFEPWGVVVQEAAASGLPMIVSDACGAGVHLLRDRWNGRSFAAGDPAHLADCLLWMHQQSDDRLIEMGARSMELSKQYTPERWSQTFTSELLLMLSARKPSLLK